MKRFRGLIRFPAFIASRYFFSRGAVRFASFMTVIAVFGVAVGVAALITVMSVMSGFSQELESKLKGFNPDITVNLREAPSDAQINQIRTKFKEVSLVTPFVTGEAVVQLAGDDGFSAVGAKIFGYKEIPPGILETADFFWRSEGFLPVWLKDLAMSFSDGVILGAEMMYQMGIVPEVNTVVQIIAPFGGVDPFGNPSPVRREYPVSGGFRSGFFEYDVKYLMMPYDEAVRLLGTQARYGLQITVSPKGWGDKNRPVITGLKTYFNDGSSVTGWTEKNKKLFLALKLEKVAMSIVLALIVVIASFSIIGVVLMLFFSKRLDLAVMLSVGAGRKKIRSIFIALGGMIGLVGSLLGVVLAVIVCYVIKRSDIVLPPTYYLDRLPVSLNIGLVITVVVVGVLISLFASYYPARRASEIDPVALLRGE